jgi:hypothetical protein
MLIFEHATHDENFFATEMSMRIEVGLGGPADQGRAGALLHQWHDMKASNETLMPRSCCGVYDLSVLLVRTQVPKLHKQQTASFAKGFMARTRRVHDVGASGVVACFVAEDSLENKDFLAKVVTVLGETSARLVAHDGGGTRYFVTTSVQQPSLDACLRAGHPRYLVVIQDYTLLIVVVDIHLRSNLQPASLRRRINSGVRLATMEIQFSEQIRYKALKLF